MQLIAARLSGRKRTIAPIILRRGLQLPIALLRTVRCNHVRRRLRTRLPSVQPRSTMHVKAVAQSRLAMSAMTNRLTNNSSPDV